MAVLKTRFEGDRGALFLLAVKTGILTLLTAGIYRFWATTRLRRWYWSSVRPGGVPLEYTGTGIEKLAGFLFAIILLAFVLTAINLTGIALSVSLMDEGLLAVFASVVMLPLLVIGIIYFARYRARRYILSRTLWRGIRFGMTPGAIGYAVRATLLLILTICTLGLALPIMTFRLEKYVTDRTWFGNARFSQSGSAWNLVGPYMPAFLTFWGSIALFGYFGYANGGTAPINPAFFQEVWALGASLVGFFLTFIFALYYRVSSVRVLAALKTAGDGMEFDLWPKTREIVKIYILGSFKTYLATVFVYMVAGGLIVLVLAAAGVVDARSVQAELASASINGLIAVIALTYLMLMLTAIVFRQTFIIFPMVAHISETFEIHQPELLGTVRQRSADTRNDAGGFAEALDVGAAF